MGLLQDKPLRWPDTNHSITITIGSSEYLVIKKVVFF